MPMLFNSVTFLFFFLPVSLIAYYLLGLLPFRWRMSLQNLLLVGLSLVFFAWGGLDAVTFLVALIIVNYLVGLLSLKFRKILLAGVVCNVGRFSALNI
ncbi:MAG TPA: hypothetical protein H9668_07665 [Firmicutes bacterium]|nr:hypothetical protein [Bacillota bacterium]